MVDCQMIFILVSSGSDVTMKNNCNFIYVFAKQIKNPKKKKKDLFTLHLQKMDILKNETVKLTKTEKNMSKI